MNNIRGNAENLKSRVASARTRQHSFILTLSLASLLIMPGGSSVFSTYYRSSADRSTTLQRALHLRARPSPNRSATPTPRGPTASQPLLYPSRQSHQLLHLPYLPSLLHEPTRRSWRPMTWRSCWRPLMVNASTAVHPLLALSHHPTAQQQQQQQHRHQRLSRE